MDKKVLCWEFTLGNPIFNIIQDYQKNITSLLTQVFGLSIIDFVGTVIRKWYPGEYQPPHSDCEAIFTYSNSISEMTPINNFSSIFIEYAALLYLNEDYQGGEIYFPEYELKIKPEKNELIFFPGTEYYMHGVEEIKFGNRLVIQNFLTTPKLQYIWNKFVINDDSIKFVDRPLDYAANNKTIFDRNNIPKQFDRRIAYE
jgi:hypothetical protein